jgi:hypothetical protein
MRTLVMVLLGTVLLIAASVEPPAWVTSDELGPRTCPEGDSSCR